MCPADARKPEPLRLRATRLGLSRLVGGGTLDCWVTHRNGDTSLGDPGLPSIDAPLDELDLVDDEHPDVALNHASGWTLSAFPGGLVVYENVEEDDEPCHLRGVERDAIARLMRAPSKLATSRRSSRRGGSRATGELDDVPHHENAVMVRLTVPGRTLARAGSGIGR
jgi:hypothetical protein